MIRIVVITNLSENLDAVISRFTRKWLQLPVSSNFTHLSLPYRKLGLNILTAKHVYIKSQFSVRRILKQSKNVEIQSLYKITSQNNIPSDALLNAAANNNSNPPSTNKQFISKTNKKFSSVTQTSIWNKFMELNEQCILIKRLLLVCSPQTICVWQSLVKNLPTNIFCFCRKALIFCLPNKSNLLRWKLSQNDNCELCSKKQTQLHTLSNCSSALKRCTWRHDSVLTCLIKNIEKYLNKKQKLFTDCPSLPYTNTSALFTNQRPDIAIQENNHITVIELTICFETNTKKSRDYKAQRYANLSDQLKLRNAKLSLVLLEFTTLGFIGKESLTQTTRFLKSIGAPRDHIIYKCMETAIRASYFIFCRRNKSWQDPELLNFT